MDSGFLNWAFMEWSERSERSGINAQFKHGSRASYARLVHFPRRSPADALVASLAVVKRKIGSQGLAAIADTGVLS